MPDRKQMNRDHTTNTSNRTPGDLDENRNLNAESSRSPESPAAARDRGERTAHGETNTVPERAEKGKMPRFGSAGSGGAEFEPGPERD